MYESSRSARARGDLIRLYFASIHKYILRTVGERARARLWESIIKRLIAVQFVIDKSRERARGVMPRRENRTDGFFTCPWTTLIVIYSRGNEERIMLVLQCTSGFKMTFMYVQLLKNSHWKNFCFILYHCRQKLGFIYFFWSYYRFFKVCISEIMVLKVQKRFGI